MPSASEIKEQVARESERRSRLAVPTFAGGFLYLLSAIIISSTLKGAPTVGLLQGLAPALSGQAGEAISPRTGEVKFFSHHASNLIIGSVLAGIAIAALTLALLLLLDATRFRRPNSWSVGRPLVLIGGFSLVFLSVGHQVVEYLDLLAGLALAAGMIGTMVNALRVGLLPRWMSYLGSFTAVLIFAPIGGAELEVVPALWMVMMGILYLGKWPNGEPPAWGAGEARPWPSQSQMRAEKRGEGQVALATGVADVAPDPARPTRSSRKRRRKRGAGR